ncbi:hypothetical protein ACQKCH_11445 [Nubsella zeaxanthinifaciens]|uniref:hypothetical protein n=1 Tax=Nubsella zeaxanthinifaciens TaxID=392412 RepID=UPI003CFED1C0
MIHPSTVAGYKDLFPNGTKSYSDFVKDIPSDVLICVFIALNNELNSPEERFQLQKRIYLSFTKTFTKKQKNELISTLNKFRVKTGNKYEGLIFGRRYLIEFVLKELNNYRICPDYEDQIIDEYNIFKAYLKIIDEVNFRDHSFIDFNKLDKKSPFWVYQMLWLPLLNQWEWNERTNLIFETFKLLCFLKFVGTEYTRFLKEYLNAFNLNSIAQLLGSFSQVNKSTYMDDEHAMLRRLVYINPPANVNQEHLIQQTINRKLGEPISLSELKANPLYLKSDRGYMVIDQSMYLRKNYRGPFFELFHNTSLSKVEGFNTYSSKVSDELERTCLVPILTILSQSNKCMVHFDDKTENVPDGYIRIDNKIFLFEYKAYLFPEKLSNKPDFEEIKKYIDQRFVSNEKSKPKGIGQLKTQIEILNGNGFEFDEVSKYNKENIEIFPILVHQDFQFSLPGVNHYLNDKFAKLLEDMKTDLKINNVTLVNLEVLLDMAICNKDIFYLESCIREYDKFISDGQSRFKMTAMQGDFLNAHLSFDQLYNTRMIEKLDDPNSTKPFLNQLLELAGISLRDFEKHV